jgi:hypothetical protein
VTAGTTWACPECDRTSSYVLTTGRLPSRIAATTTSPTNEHDCRHYAAPIARRCWKHSRQNTGRPCVGRNGTVVSLPHCEQVVLVSERIGVAPPFAPPPVPSARFALHALQRLGSFLKPLSAKNICSPAVNTNSELHSEHFNTLSWNSMSRPPLPGSSERDASHSTVGPGRGNCRRRGESGCRTPGPEVPGCNNPTTADRVYITEARRTQEREEGIGGPSLPTGTAD